MENCRANFPIIIFGLVIYTLISFVLYLSIQDEPAKIEFMGWAVGTVFLLLMYMGALKRVSFINYIMFICFEFSIAVSYYS